MLVPEGAPVELTPLALLMQSWPNTSDDGSRKHRSAHAWNHGMGVGPNCRKHGGTVWVVGEAAHDV